jgi:hypothetical protein
MTDWRGWPYRRPLDRFSAIMWQRDYARLCPVPAARVEDRLREVQRDGRFHVECEGPWGMILVRVSGDAGTVGGGSHP